MIAIYCRTSKSKEEDYSIPTQKESGVEFAKDLEEEYKFYIDEGISGTKGEDARTGFAQMISDIKRNQIDIVYCIDQSRIERNTSIWNFFVGECINNNCKYYPNGNELDLNDPDSMLFANLLSLVNSYYAALTSKKVKLANYKKAKEGKTHGLKPYGYTRDKDNNYVIIDEEAKNVRRMFQLSLEGIGTYTIANILNDEGIPTKFNGFKGKIKRKDKYTKKEFYYDKSDVKWRGNVIHDMLRNEIYKGVRVWDDLRIEIPDAAIVSQELWDNVNANLQKNKKNVGKKAKYNYLLNGIVLCGHCGNEVIGKKRPKGRDNAYKCKGKRPPYKNCIESRGISIPKLESFIINHLFNSKELKKLLSEAPKNGTEITRLQSKLDKIKKDIENQRLLNKRFFKALSNPELKDDDKILKKYSETKLEIVKLEEDAEILELKISGLSNKNRNERTRSLIKSYTSDISFDDLKRLVHSIVEEIKIHHVKDKKSGYYLVKIKYRNYEEESIFMTNWSAMKWHWLTRWRSAATTQAELEKDTEDLKELYKYFGIDEAIQDDFVGNEVIEGIHSVIQLNKDELYYSD